MSKLLLLWARRKWGGERELMNPNLHELSKQDTNKHAKWLFRRNHFSRKNRKKKKSETTYPRFKTFRIAFSFYSYSPRQFKSKITGLIVILVPLNLIFDQTIANLVVVHSRASLFKYWSLFHIPEHAVLRGHSNNTRHSKGGGVDKVSQILCYTF